MNIFLILYLNDPHSLESAINMMDSVSVRKDGVESIA